MFLILSPDSLHLFKTKMKKYLNGYLVTTYMSSLTFLDLETTFRALVGIFWFAVYIYNLVWWMIVFKLETLPNAKLCEFCFHDLFYYP